MKEFFKIFLGFIIISGVIYASEINEKRVRWILSKYKKSENKELFLKNIEKELLNHPDEEIKKALEIIKNNKVEEYLKNFEKDKKLKEK
ncbi:MAG: hypothetical protein ABIN23_03045 [candidate division WOR-3 bacterium]